MHKEEDAYDKVKLGYQESMDTKISYAVLKWQNIIDIKNSSVMAIRFCIL